MSGDEEYQGREFGTQADVRSDNPVPGTRYTLRAHSGSAAGEPEETHLSHPGEVSHRPRVQFADSGSHTLHRREEQIDLDKIYEGLQILTHKVDESRKAITDVRGAVKGLHGMVTSLSRHVTDNSPNARMVGMENRIAEVRDHMQTLNKEVAKMASKLATVDYGSALKLHGVGKAGQPPPKMEVFLTGDTIDQCQSRASVPTATGTRAELESEREELEVDIDMLNETLQIERANRRSEKDPIILSLRHRLKYAILDLADIKQELSKMGGKVPAPQSRREPMSGGTQQPRVQESVRHPTGPGSQGSRFATPGVQSRGREEGSSKLGDGLARMRKDMSTRRAEEEGKAGWGRAKTPARMMKSSFDSFLQHK